VHQDGSAAVAMLGLPGFVLLAVSEVDGRDTERWVRVQPVGSALLRLLLCSVLVRPR
jgi:hypothetical protein